jgi:serine protease Do
LATNEVERAAGSSTEAAVLEHLTGPSRGTATWLGERSLDIAIDRDRFLRVWESRPDEPPSGLIARLRRAGDSYKLDAVENYPVWVNGVLVTSRELKHRDMIEFGEAGPLSRFRLHRGQRPAHTTVADVLSDALAYLRTSRQPINKRLIRAACQALRRLTRQTTILFRLGVILAIVALATLAYQQRQLNVLLQQRIESGASRLEALPERWLVLTRKR